MLGEHRDLRHDAQLLGQVQRAAGADVSVVFGNGKAPYLTAINATEPDADLAGRPANPATDPAYGSLGQVRDQVAEVVEALGTYNQGASGQAHPEAYGAFVADSLPPQRAALHPRHHRLCGTPWNGIRNGKGLFEDLGRLRQVVINEDFSTRLTQRGAITDYRPRPAAGLTQKHSSTTSPTSPPPADS